MWYKRANSEPWQMTPNEFLDHHNTGYIRSDAYESYSTIKGLEWVRYEKFTDFIEALNIDGQTVEIRSEPEKTRFVKKDSEGEIMRDPQGMAVFLTDEEAQQFGLPTHTHTVAAFWNKQAVGLASDEWGSTGIWVVKDFQRKGIGTRLLQDLHRLNPRLAKNKLGQMTSDGQQFTKSYHKTLVQKALNEGKQVPPNILEQYPDLQRPTYPKDEG